MRVVVFGGAGFVGLNVVQRLLAAGDRVVLFDRTPPPAPALDAFSALGGTLALVTADIGDGAAVAAAMRGAEGCVYGAAITPDADRESAEARLVVEVNLLGLLTVLEEAARAGVGRLVNLSSGSAYGDAAFDTPPLDEGRTYADPRTLYAITKFAGERLGGRLGALWGLDVRSVRLSAVFGDWEHATGVRDTLSPPFQIVRASLLGEPVRLERVDVRDWAYAPDLAGAIEAVLKHRSPRFDLYNLGPPVTWDLLEWAHALRRHLPGAEPVIDASAPTISSHGARSRSAFSTARLRDDIGYRGFSDMATTAARYARWARAHRHFVTG